MAGRLLTEEERKYILDNIKDGAGRIAFDLGWKFKEKNGGHVPRKTVRAFITREQCGQPITIHLPAKILRLAKERGIMKDDLIRYAESIIIQKVEGSVTD